MEGGLRKLVGGNGSEMMSPHKANAQGRTCSLWIATTRCVRLPEEFRAYLERANGMRDGDMDSERMIHFYGLDRLVPIASNETGSDEDGHYFIFADFMIGSHEYAFALAGRDYGRIAIVDDSRPPRVVANSFVDFMEKYLHSPASLWRAK